MTRDDRHRAAPGIDDPLYPAIEPWDAGRLEVGGGHSIHYEQCGNRAGHPVVFLHGGPGSGCSASHRRLLDPAGYRVVLFDQRGCGRSTPRGACTDNTTADLVADIERLREHLGIARWLVFGGSWGAALALAYCARHRSVCTGAILRGIFLTGRADLDWFFRDARALMPDAWAQLAAIVPPRSRNRLKQWYLDALCGSDEERVQQAVRHWLQWENSLARPGHAPSPLPALGSEEAIVQRDKYRVQAHYLRNECFLGEAAMLKAAATLNGLPVAILHGRLDLVCRPANAWKLHHALPGSRLALVEGAGHSPFDLPMAHALVSAGRHFLAHGDFTTWPEA